jgi:hypothetical protein
VGSFCFIFRQLAHPRVERGLLPLEIVACDLLIFHIVVVTLVSALGHNLRFLEIPLSSVFRLSCLSSLTSNCEHVYMRVLNHLKFL